MRPRKHNRDLPPCVFLRRGKYYLVKQGKWTPLGADKLKALNEYARLTAQPQGGMAALITEAMPHILKGKATTTQNQYNVAARRLSEILAEFSPSKSRLAMWRRSGGHSLPTQWPTGQSRCCAWCSTTRLRSS